MRPLYSERLDLHKLTPMTKIGLHHLRKLRVYMDRIAVGRFLFDIPLVDRTVTGDSPRIGHYMIMAIRDINRIELGCFWKESKKGKERIQIDVTFHHVKGRTFSGVLRNPLGFLKAMERTEAGINLKGLLDISTIQKRVRVDQKVRHALIKASVEEWNPTGAEGDLPAVVNYLEGMGFNILHP